MNEYNVCEAINIMKRAGRVNMVSWQGQPTTDITSYCATSEQDLHACGNSACFAGWVAVSPEWKEFGGIIGDSGYPDLPKNDPDTEQYPDEVIAKWLGISDVLASCFIFGGAQRTRIRLLSSAETFSVFYGKKWEEVEAQDVIKKLEHLKNNGELSLFQSYFENLKSFDLKSLKFSYSVKDWYEEEEIALEKIISSFE